MIAGPFVLPYALPLGARGGAGTGAATVYEVCGVLVLAGILLIVERRASKARRRGDQERAIERAQAEAPARKAAEEAHKELRRRLGSD